MLVATTKVRRLIYADIERVIDRWSVGGEADGGRVQGCESLCPGGASDWWKGSSGAAIFFTSNAVPTRLQSEAYASQSDQILD